MVGAAPTLVSRCAVIFRDAGLWRLARPQLSRRLGRQGAYPRLLRDWRDVKTRNTGDLYVVAFQRAFLDETEVSSARQARVRGQKRFLVLPDESPQPSLPEILLKLRIRSLNRIHMPEEQTDIKSLVRRFVAALARMSTEPTIADAWWEDDTFIVLSPTFERLRVPAGDIPKIRDASDDERQGFEIDSYGEYVYWPAQDVHMGWSQFEQAVAPQARLRAQQRSDAFNKRYGQAIRRVRERAGLRQSDVGGLADRTVRRIEQGRTRATVKALTKLAAAHGMNTNDYLAALAAELGKT